MKWVGGNVMGKSYKKTPVIKENGESKKKMKTIANKAVRRKMKDADFEIANGNAYRKEYESYDIADYISRQTKHDAIEAYKNKRWIQEKYTLEKWLNEWKKAMLRK